MIPFLVQWWEHLKWASRMMTGTTTKMGEIGMILVVQKITPNHQRIWRWSTILLKFMPIGQILFSVFFLTSCLQQLKLQAWTMESFKLLSRATPPISRDSGELNHSVRRATIKLNGISNSLDFIILPSTFLAAEETDRDQISNFRSTVRIPTRLQKNKPLLAPPENQWFQFFFNKTS